MRKIVLLLTLLLNIDGVFAQTHDTTALSYNLTSCFTSEIDTMAYMALVLHPERKLKTVARNPWNTNVRLASNPIYDLSKSQPSITPDFPYQQNSDTLDAYQRFNNFNNSVLNGNIKKPEAQKEFRQLLDHINHWLFIRSQVDLLGDAWVFPLKGYNYHAIGGNGDGYSDKGYRYLDGNKHGAHPAHDIFINDKNQDCIDDRSHKPVDVLAVDHGVVIACSDTWQTNSDMRGGKYIWIYHFDYGYHPNGYKKTHSYQTGTITYYAHNSKIFVHPGQEVKPGDKIAEVGRTGYNAYKKRSPTHLHFSAFKLVDGLPVPFNPYQQLKKAKTL
jgi:hypothetical protein